MYALVGGERVDRGQGQGQWEVQSPCRARGEGGSGSDGGTWGSPQRRRNGAQLEEVRGVGVGKEGDKMWNLGVLRAGYEHPQRIFLGLCLQLRQRGSWAERDFHPRGLG